jgi:gluconate 2-dehydrogenase gamma chain
MGPYRRQRELYRTGLAGIDRAAANLGKPFADLDAPRQTALLQSLDGALKRFFTTVVAHTMQGYYGDPRHGGNRDAVSWRMLGVPVVPVRGRNRYEFPKQGV